MVKYGPGLDFVDEMEKAEDMKFMVYFHSGFDNNSLLFAEKVIGIYQPDIFWYK